MSYETKGKHRGHPPGPDGDAPKWFWGNGKTKHMLPRGLWRLLVRNIKELEALLCSERSYCSEAAHRVFCKNHKATVEGAARPALDPRSHPVGSE